MPLLPGGSLFGFIRDINERRENAKIEDVQRNYMGDEEGIIKAIKEIDPNKGEAYKQNYVKQQQELEDRQRKRLEADFGTIGRAFRGMPQGTDYGKVMDEATPYFREQGISDASLRAFRTMLMANPQFADTQTDDTYGTVVESVYKPQNVGPGAALIQGGKVIHNQPKPLESVVTGPGQRRVTFNPATGEYTDVGDDSAPGLPAPPGIAASGSAAPGSGPGPGAGPPLATRQATGDDIERLAVAAIPGINVTSRARTPEKNRAVGGTEDSYHLTTRGGRARDFTPPKGMSMGQLHSELARTYGDGWDVINEGDHIHVEPAPGGGAIPSGRSAPRGVAPAQAAAPQPGGGPVVSRKGGVYVPPNPKANSGPFVTLTADELKAEGLPEGSFAQRGPDGKLVNLKLPSAAQQKVSKFDYGRATKALEMTQTLNTQMTRLLKMPGLPGAVGKVQGRLPGLLISSNAEDARNALKTLRENVGLQQLMSAKEVSSQGASGFGNLSNAEGKRLESIFGSLDDTSSDGAILSNLKEAQQIIAKAEERMIWQIQQAEAGKDWRVPPVGATRNGFRFTGGAPNNPNNWQRMTKPKPKGRK